jgi:cyclohexanone monooxygenase
VTSSPVPDGDRFGDPRRPRDGRTDTTDRFTAEGIRLGSGATLPADLVVVATGLS